MAIIQLVIFLTAGALAAAQGNNTYSSTPAPIADNHKSDKSFEFFAYIIAAIATVIFLACLGCIWRCKHKHVRGMMYKRISRSLGINAKIKGAVSEYHLNAEPECHYQTVVMTQPTPVMVDQHVTFSINR